MVAAPSGHHERGHPDQRQQQEGVGRHRGSGRQPDRPDPPGDRVQVSRQLPQGHGECSPRRRRTLTAAAPPMRTAMTPPTTHSGRPPDPSPGSAGSAITAVSVVVGLAEVPSTDAESLGAGELLALADFVRVADAVGYPAADWPAVGDEALDVDVDGVRVGDDDVGAFVGVFVGVVVGDLVGVGAGSSRATGVTPGVVRVELPCHAQPTYPPSGTVSEPAPREA
ncbi:hypothetical protein NOCA2350017 [metagenome]|uniref:Uncharacterized protein n=1 Tax=metagenome TaxID=256318 RepID=A0A2P2C376_9ZZZZ